MHLLLFSCLKHCILSNTFLCLERFFYFLLIYTFSSIVQVPGRPDKGFIDGAMKENDWIKPRKLANITVKPEQSLYRLLDVPTRCFDCPNCRLHKFALFLFVKFKYYI